MIGTLIVCASLLAVDGDTIKCDGVNMRDMGDGAPFVSGYNAPETRNAKCQQELELGRAATAALGELLPSASVYASGEADRYGRPLVWVRLPDGSSAGSVLVQQGLAVEWRPGQSHSWC